MNFTDPITISTLTAAAFTLTDNGTNVPIPASPALVVTQTGPSTYQITGLDNETSPLGNYVLTVDSTQVDQIAASMVEFGWTNPILIDENGSLPASVRSDWFSP